LRTATKLILSLTLVVGVIMTLGGYFILQQRTSILESALRSELRAHAITLQIALQDGYAAGNQIRAQSLINHLGENPRVFSVILFDEQGQILMLSNPSASEELRQPPALARVLESNEAVELTQGGEFFSILMPVRLDQQRRGAFQISQPRSFIQADIARARRDIALITLALFGATILVVLLMTRINVLRPINDLLTGTMAFSEGDLNYRVIVPGGGGEIADLAQKFNQMANHLMEQRQQMVNAAEEQLALERSLKQSERLATVGRLAAGIAHEMGAPLNVIKGRVDMLRKREDVPPERRERWLQIIDAQVDAMARIVRQLLTLARPFNLQREAVSVTQLIHGVVDLIQPEATANNTNIILTTSEQLQIDGDRNLLHQVLLNLCLNALHMMPNGGSLRIEAQPDERQQDGSTFLALRVTDTGPGIAPDHLPHIFDPFFTTKEIGKGTGLGLTISRRIIEEHNGWIEAENQPDGGAAFTVWLPKVNETAATTSSHQPAGARK
jgi:two-component system, NtrC family, sensor kinase